MNQLLETLGFRGDPFASTNADDEPELADYFVPPPYFASVQGDPDNPRPDVVHAPRGGGKTAQKRMIEIASQSAGFMCVAYDRFETPAGFSLEDATWEYHTKQICRLITVGTLAALDGNTEVVEGLSDHQKRVIKFCAERFLSDLTADEFEAAIRSVKSLGDRAKDLWEKWGGPIAGLVDAVLERLELRAVNLDDAFTSKLSGEESLRYLLAQLSDVVRAIGFKSVYVLVDRVDEIDLTSTDATNAFVFIRPLLIDLPTLEQEGLGFKFFLWDAMEEDFQAAGVRADRVSVHSLHWSIDDLKLMISQRLKAFSGGRTDSLRALMCDSGEIDVDTLGAHLAEGSPRDLIRLMARVVAEETRISDEKECISSESFWEGVDSFSEIRATELTAGQLTEIRRVGAAGRLTFTVNVLASDIYRVKAQSARARVQGWMRTGMVAQIGDVPNPGNRPMYLYGPIDLRLAIAMLSNASAEEVLGNFALICPECESVAISDETEITCRNCSHRFALSDARSLVEACT